VQKSSYAKIKSYAMEKKQKFIYNHFSSEENTKFLKVLKAMH